MLMESLVRAIVAHEHSPGFFQDIRAQVATVAECPQNAPELDRLARGGEVDIAPAVRVIFGGDLNFTDARVAVLAHWSREGRPDPALAVLLTALRGLGYKVAVTCGCEPGDVPYWATLADALVRRTCPGYDFTSWKAAFTALPSLYAAREVLCVNDSVLGPIGSLGAVHTAMDAVPCQFWGMVESREKWPHLQSFYLVFRQAALKHPAFRRFWGAVDANPDKFATVLRYEILLSPWLARHGLVPGAYVPAAALPQTNVNPCHYFWRPLIQRFGMPFLKRDLLRRAGDHPFLHGWETVLREHGFDPHVLPPELSRRPVQGQGLPQS